MTAQALRDRRTQAERGYGQPHERLKRRLAPIVAAGRAVCARCGEPILPWEPWDLGHSDDRRRYLGPEHAGCNRRAGGLRAAKARWQPPPEPELAAEPEGIAAGDERWRRPWLEPLLALPADATWPRYMTAPHPRAEGSLGAEFCAWAQAREGMPLRWWQRLAATRLLEHDGAEQLVWEALLLSLARQLGKSWLLRELMLWRIHQGERFGEPQDVLHIGKDILVVKEVMRPALFWADADPARYKVNRNSGETQIERREDGSRWMLRARSATHGYSISAAAVDEAWKVPADDVDEGIAPTMAERAQSQLWLISTAHRQATALMLARRKAALEHLHSGAGDLLIEWSAPRAFELGSAEAWRQASPHWTPRREALVRRQYETARAGEGEAYEDESDPIEAFRAQWLNQWPDRSVPIGKGEPLLPAGLWAYLAEPGVSSQGPCYVAVEDNFGQGAAIAVAAEVDDGRLECDGQLYDDWDSAMAAVWRLGLEREIRVLLIGASLMARVPAEMRPAPEAAGTGEARVGLPVLRDLAAGGKLVHEGGGDLGKVVAAAQVRELQGGLGLAQTKGSHLVRALAWAVSAAHDRRPDPVIY